MEFRRRGSGTHAHRGVGDGAESLARPGRPMVTIFGGSGAAE
jgi:hypothetical protein